MTVALRRAKLLDAGVVSLLLLLLSGVNYGLQRSGRIQGFSNKVQERAYVGILVTCWPLFLLGSIPMFGFWWSGRAADKSHYSNAKPRHLFGVMLAATLISLGSLLLSIAHLIWVISFGFRKFHLVSVLGLISFVLLFWISIQVALLVREASVVRKHIIDHPNDNNLPTPDDFGYDMNANPAGIPKNNDPFA